MHLNRQECDLTSCLVRETRFLRRHVDPDINNNGRVGALLRKSSAIGGKSWYLNSCSLALYLTVAVTRVARLAFLKPNSRNLFFFLNWLASKIHLAFGLFPGFFLNAKIICTKITHHPFSKSFYFKKNVFWSVTFRSFSATKSLCKKAPAANR